MNAESPAWVRALRRGENGLVALALALMVLLPCVEIFLRKFFSSGIPASTPIVQHLVLAVGMLGGALAAREGRLLAFSTFSNYFRGRLKQGAQIFSGAYATAVTAFLCGASLQFVLASRRMGKELAYGIPVWAVQTLLTIGFAVVACRLVWHAGTTWRGRLLTGFLAAAFAAVALWAPIPEENFRAPALLGLLLAAICGAPIFTLIGGAAMILLWTFGEPIASVPLKHYSLTVNPTLPAIPLFTLAGYFLAEGGAAHRLVRVVNTLFSGIRGGPAIVVVVLCAFFTSFTGASGVTILALGGLLLPILKASGYSERNSLGLLTGAGSLGLLFPPCLPPILYSIVASNSGGAEVSMEDMFLGGLLPGILLMALTTAWGMTRGRSVAVEKPPFDAKEAWRAVRAAKWEILVPVVALTALFGGFATPVEAAALTALYAFIAETFVYRDLRVVKDGPRVISEAGLLVGGVLLILGVALGFTYYLIEAEIADHAVEWVTARVDSKLMFLLFVNLFLILVGCLMDIYSAIVVVVPLLVPLGRAYGIDMVHLGVIFLANLELGYLTPPVGMNLFLSSYRFGKPIGEVVRASFPMLLVLLVGVLLITYIPQLTTTLPQWLNRRSNGLTEPDSPRNALKYDGCLDRENSAGPARPRRSTRGKPRHEPYLLQFSLANELPRVLEPTSKYADQPMDLADACLVRMTELTGRSMIWTLDRRDFMAYRRHGRQPVSCAFPENG